MTLTEMAERYGLTDGSALRHAIRRGVLNAEIAGKTYFVEEGEAERYAQEHLRKRGPKAKDSDSREIVTRTAHLPGIGGHGCNNDDNSTS